jgi:hypothetical protein
MPENYKEIRLGGCVGSIIAFLIAYLGLIAYILGYYYNSRWSYVSWPVLIFAPLCSALAAALFGFLAGRMASRSKSVNRAFLFGGLVFFFIVFGSFLLPFFFFQLNSAIGKNSFIYMKLGIAFTPVLGCAVLGGSLLCGLTAIIVRDYRQSQKIRLIPQFTLQELLIVITLSIFLMSLIASIAPLVAWASP